VRCAEEKWAQAVEWECAGGWVDGGIVAYFFLLAVALPSLTVLGACVTFRITREEERARVDAAEGEAGRGRRRHCSPRHASLRSAPRIYRCLKQRRARPGEARVGARLNLALAGVLAVPRRARSRRRYTGVFV
jgi:hypothetical protein